MRKLITLLIVLLNFMLIAQPVLGDQPTTVRFTEKLADDGKTKYFNPDNATPLPILLNLTNGLYKGPQFPFAAVKLDIHNYCNVTMSFYVNFSTQDIQNGVWHWKFLAPFKGDIQNAQILIYENNTPYPKSILILSSNQAKYGTVYDLYAVLWPGKTYKITYTFFTSKPVSFFLAREHQPVKLSVSDVVYTNVSAAYAFLFESGMGDAGMGAMQIPARTKLTFYFYNSLVLSTTLTGTPDKVVTTHYFVTIGLPIIVNTDTTVSISIKEEIPGKNITYTNFTRDVKTGFLYIFQSNPYGYNYSETDGHGYKVWFTYTFDTPVSVLFCVNAPDAPQIGYPNPIQTEPTVYYDNRSLDFMGIVFFRHGGPQQAATVHYENSITTYDFGFASVQEYSTGTYVIVAKGNYEKWVEIENRTVKSIGAQVDEMLYGGEFEFSANNNIYSVIGGAISKIIDIGNQIIQFLKNLGTLIWQNLMKFVKWISNLMSWITDSLGSIFNYLLYIVMPIAMMFIISYIARWASGLKTKGVEK